MDWALQIHQRGHLTMEIGLRALYLLTQMSLLITTNAKPMIQQMSRSLICATKATTVSLLIKSRLLTRMDHVYLSSQSIRRLFVLAEAVAVVIMDHLVAVVAVIMDHLGLLEVATIPPSQVYQAVGSLLSFFLLALRCTSLAEWHGIISEAARQARRCSPIAASGPVYLDLSRTDVSISLANAEDFVAEGPCPPLVRIMQTCNSAAVVCMFYIS